MGYAAGQLALFPFVPDWAHTVTESLAWLTDIEQAADGAQQARQLRAAPRRGFAFSGTVDRDDRRLADTFGFATGVKQMLLPIYVDAQVLAAALPAASLSIPCATAGYDFVAGGRALLWRDATTWEVVQVDTVGGNALALSAATVADWAAGTRLYPIRAARLAAALQASADTDEIAAVDANVLIDEPCDWAAAWPSAASYRGQAVLEWRGDESDGMPAEYDRDSGSIDYDTGPVYYFDAPRQPFRQQPQTFLLYQRASQATFRSLLYQLAGRACQVWVPSWTNDLRLTQAVASNATTINVAWAGYTAFGGPQPNRRDIRLELFNGTIKYRRITASVDHGTYEALTLDSAFGIAVNPAAVRQINWLSLCAQATDAASIQHDTDADGIAVSTLTWQALKNDV